MKLLSIAENYRWHTFRSKTDNTKNEQVPSTQCSELSSTNDLYFTRKIDILDKIGRRIRTEHIIPHDEEQNKRKIKPNTRNKRKKMKITNNCSLRKQNNAIL
ncbi:hypothetical protein HHI36_004129 [Cryptolaemus montrouzieri]|uniref:Uncharacterized protein n=1 Tax=Cryptolaemus montrouzieri TaxID=559131 RepID=A0ABD2NR25_9CUCU